MKKGISIHIGLDYNGTLPTCGKDALDMQKIATSRNFETIYLLQNEEATCDSVRELITLASETLVAEDILFVSYSGHGKQVKDENGDEEIDESWCLHDNYLLDDELHYLWTLFAEDVRIFIVSDSCFSATVTKAAPSIQVAPISKFLSDAKARQLYPESKSFISAIKKKLAGKKSEPIKATVKLIAGCQDNEESWIVPNAENSLLTAEINKVWDGGQFVGTTVDFFEKVKEQVVEGASSISRSQTPNYYTIGKENESFDTQKPFSIYE